VELNPLRHRLALLRSGLVPPDVETACELGFGQGVSANIHAAAMPARWYGTDFSPTHVAHARRLAAASSADVVLSDEAFTDFTRRPDLPDFDFIGLHGTWTWISDDDRAAIVDFVRRKLRVGGVLYVSYNTLPGWATFTPLRALMAEHAERVGTRAQSGVDRLTGALDFIDTLLAANPAYARANPQVADVFKQMKAKDKAYLAHELMTRHWVPMDFGTMAKWLEPAKVSFACSANLIEHFDAVNLTTEQRECLAKIPDVQLRESARDFMANQQFRRDYWVKGASRLTAPEQIERLRAERFILVTPRADVPLKLRGATLQAQIYEPILDFLADHVAREAGEIEQGLAGKGIALNIMIEALILLVGMGHLALAQPEGVSAAVRERTDKLNAHLLAAARSRRDTTVLASPIAGGVVGVHRFQQLFLLALREGHGTPAEWAQFACRLLERQGERMVKDGAALPPEQFLAEMTGHATRFADRELPILRALQVA
jgi:SAM-dependent methyltransferase